MKTAALHLVLFLGGINLPSLLAGDGLVDVQPLTAHLEERITAHFQPPQSTPHSCAIELTEVERLHVTFRPAPVAAPELAPGS